MAGADFTANISGVSELQKLLNELEGGAKHKKELLEMLGGIVESQTRERLESIRTSPDGEPWEEWSIDYAKTRHANHRLLQNEGHLVDSIASVVNDGFVEVGTNLIYAATHQYGDDSRGIPQRQFMGLSQRDNEELQDALNDWMDNIINA